MLKRLVQESEFLPDTDVVRLDSNHFFPGGQGCLIVVLFAGDVPLEFFGPDRWLGDRAAPALQTFPRAIHVMQSDLGVHQLFPDPLILRFALQELPRDRDRCHVGMIPHLMIELMPKSFFLSRALGLASGQEQTDQEQPDEGFTNGFEKTHLEVGSVSHRINFAVD
jgi:hypothetical protein